MSGNVPPSDAPDQAPESPGSAPASWSERWAACRAWADKHRWLVVALGGSLFVAMVFVIMAVRALTGFAAKNQGVTIDGALESLDAGNYEKAIDAALRVLLEAEDAT